MLLKGKVGIVTGATAGLGKATALAMAREGAAVTLAGRNVQDGEALLGEIRSAGGRAIFERTDVTDPEAIERMVARTVEEFGQLDIAYNNAGVESPGCPVQDLDIGAVKHSYDVNVHSILLSMKFEIPHMLKTGGGSIVNATSILGLEASPGRAIYVSAIIPMGRVGRAEEVAEAVVWLCSDRSSFVTGVILPIDGGTTCKMG